MKLTHERLTSSVWKIKAHQGTMCTW